MSPGILHQGENNLAGDKLVACHLYPSVNSFLLSKTVPGHPQVSQGYKQDTGLDKFWILQRHEGSTAISGHYLLGGQVRF